MTSLIDLSVFHPYLLIGISMAKTMDSRSPEFFHCYFIIFGNVSLPPMSTRCFMMT